MLHDFVKGTDVVTFHGQRGLVGVEFNLGDHNGLMICEQNCDKLVYQWYVEETIFSFIMQKLKVQKLQDVCLVEVIQSDTFSFFTVHK